MAIVILTSREDVAQFLDSVIEHADAHRQAFGFLSQNAYKDWALQEKIHVAIEAVSGKKRYFGHIIFGGSNLQGRIFQAYVTTSGRGRNIGKMLVDSAIEKCKQRGFLSVVARVADDLTDANKFWQKVGFKTIKVVDGGKSAGRRINIRTRDLDVPSLLDFMSKPASTIPQSLGIGVDTTSSAPIYAFDLNVIFDIVKDRPRSTQAGQVLGLAFNNHIRLSISAEFLEELRRVSSQFPNDPMLKLAQTLPKLAAPSSGNDFTEMLTDLTAMIFPNQLRDNKLSTQDKSDIRHIATSIHHGITGFVTSEKALLRATDDLWKKYGLEIIAPEELIENQDADPRDSLSVGAVATSTDQHITIVDYRSTQKRDLVAFLISQRVPRTEVLRLLGKGAAWSEASGLAVFEGDSIVATGLWDSAANPRGFAEINIYVDDACINSKIIAEHLIETASTYLSSKSPVVMSLPITTQNSLIRKISVAHGFRSVDEELSAPNSLQKIAFGRPLTSENWKKAARKIKKISGVSLPAKMPKSSNGKLLIQLQTPNGKNVTIDSKELENLLSPVLVLFSSRPCAIVPIRRAYADDLLGTSDHNSLLEHKEAVLKRVRTYFCTPRAASILKPGTALVFYESGGGSGRSSAIAIGRVLSSRIEFKDDIPIDVLTDGVLDEKMFHEIVKGKQILSVSFDNILKLPSPVPFARLKQLNCADDSNLVTAKTISAHELEQVIKDGWKDGD